eukprot:CAMPEP_0185736850 /NCGR_PEP_ID=MMETSP1171-20130828/28938_1 /TAXON_ID=374046 /ORGANISM="Helicotheca tamensis, Strain CCMP826" /LENGTH=174 /DNA_ID=CAMNT_0028407595 /DNA_START=39 /DNA_END=560 /DNA_ORIENTATION=-
MPVHNRAIKIFLLYTFVIHSPSFAFQSSCPTTSSASASASSPTRTNVCFQMSTTISEPYNADKDETEQLRLRTLQQRKKSQQQSSRANTSIQNDDPEWKFFDTARVHVSGGDGGNGCVAFRREKGEPMGGPSGGRGGSGGSIYMRVDSTLNTLASLRNKVHVRAKTGKNGIGKG